MPQEDDQAGSPRRRVLQLVKNLWKKQRSSAYSFVHRGPINWARFPFDKHSRACAILVDESDLFSNALTGARTMTLTFEIFAKITEGDQLGMDDELLDEFYDDARQVIVELEKATYEDGKTPYILDRKKGEGQSRAVEAHDADLGVQGLITTQRIDF